MNRVLLLFFIYFDLSYCIWLTYEEAVLDSPFEIASIGYYVPFPGEDAVLIRGGGEHWRNWYKVDLVKNDTSIYLDSTIFNWKGDDLYISKLSFSDGQDKLLVTTNTKKVWRHSTLGTYFVLNIKLRTLIPLTDSNENLRNVKFCPNGENVAYVRTDNNLYVFNISRGRERQLTNSGSETIINGHFGWLYEEELTGIDGYRWSPDGNSIAYWEEDESSVTEFHMINNLSQYPEIHTFRYPKAGEANPSMKIALVNINGAGRKWIEKAYVNNDYLPWMEWINNEKIAFMKLSRDQKKWDIYAADRTSGKSVLILTETDTKGWLDNHGHIYFLKDGKIVWISEKSGFKHIWMSKHSGSNSWPITQGKWEVSRIVHIDESEELIYFIANKESVYGRKLYKIRFDGTDLSILTAEEGDHTIELTGSKKYFIDTYSSMKIPKLIKFRQLETGNIIRTLDKTSIEQFTNYEWSYPDIVHFQSLDSSVQLSGRLILPSNYSKGKKYPVIVHGYGMPGTQIVWNRWGSTWEQYLVQQGYIVFSMDSRGMSGRGEEFKNLSYGDMSKYLSSDHVAGVQFLINEGYADPKRIGAWGWSGGGYFTCLMLTRNGKYFKAGVAVAPCTDFRLYDTAYTERYMGLPRDNKDGYDSTSVLSWINLMEGSLLLMHGTEDDNVHIQHTAQFVEKSIRAGKDVEWLQYPARNHSISGGGSRIHLYNKMMEFFKQKL